MTIYQLKRAIKALVMIKFNATKRAFSLLEIIIAIVILGTLLFMALPKFYIGQDDAKLALAKSQVAAVISGISVYHSNAILSNQKSTYPNLKSSDSRLFQSVIKGGIASDNTEGWRAIDDTTFIYSLAGERAVFSYDPISGDFDCAPENSDRKGLCKALLE